MESGPKYVATIEGILQLLVIMFSCTTFALLADSNGYSSSSTMKWVFAAFIVSFSISFLLFAFRISGLSDKMSCSGPCSYDGVDFAWAWFSAIWCTAASIAFAVNFPLGNKHSKAYGENVASVCLAFITSILYGIEAFVLRVRAPMNMGYVATLNGWIKSILVGFGAATFGLLVDSAPNPSQVWWCEGYNSCYSGITYAVAVYIIAWGVTTLIWLAHMGSEKTLHGPFMKFEAAWSVLSVVLFFTASSCFAAYMKCSGNDFEQYPQCQKRLSGVIIGFVTGVIYIVDAVLLVPRHLLNK